MIELIGILGAIFILIGFYEVSAGKWDGKSYQFEIVNLLGGIFLAIYAVNKHAYANILLNTIFAAIALYAIIHSMQRYAHRKQKRLKKIP